MKNEMKNMNSDNKNIYIFPTTKESRLVINWENDICYKSKPYLIVGTQHMYITNDDKLKVKDWCLDSEGVMKCTEHAGFMDHYFSKIVLTTDPQLINDGVQAIPDDFMKWYVNEVFESSLIEYVNLIKLRKETGYEFLGYEIIIPDSKENEKH